jgi:hypothetical protein
MRSILIAPLLLGDVRAWLLVFGHDLSPPLWRLSPCRSKSCTRASAHGFP